MIHAYVDIILVVQKNLAKERLHIQYHSLSSKIYELAGAVTEQK